MKVLSWNVQGAFPYYTPIERIENQIQYLRETAECPDIIALNEVASHSFSQQEVFSLRVASTKAYLLNDNL